DKSASRTATQRRRPPLSGYPRTATTSVTALPRPNPRPPPTSTPVPYATLFRSHPRRLAARPVGRATTAAAHPAARGRCATPGSRDRKRHTSELQSLRHLVCRLLLEKKKIWKPLPPSPQDHSYPTRKRPLLIDYL